MIKSLLEHDDDLIDEKKFETEKPNDALSEEPFAPNSDSDENDAESIQAIYEATIGDDLPFAETPPTADAAPPISEPNAAEAVNYQSLDESENYESPEEEPFVFDLPAAETISEQTERQPVAGTIFQTTAEPESTAETVRRSGLAYAAAITLFGSVVFMLIIGWGAGLLFGNTTLGIVGGIVLGAIIGFIQFFRITSQIFKK